MYTDLEETIVDLGRPLLANGIARVLRRPDLGERSLLLTLAAITPQQRRTEREILAALEARRPALLGALLDACVEGLRRLPGVHLDAAPRLADYARWATACETAIWPAGTFAAALGRNRAAVLAELADEDAVVEAVLRLMVGQETWRGTATELLAALEADVGDAERRSKTWPGAPSVLGRRLRAAAKTLRESGVTVTTEAASDHRRTRTITLSSFSPKEETSLPSVPSAPDRKSLENIDTSSDGMRTASDGTDSGDGADEEIEL
jgi:hypothetical protein